MNDLLCIGEAPGLLKSSVVGGAFQLVQLSGPRKQWLHRAQPSGMFGITVGERHYTSQDLRYVGLNPVQREAGLEEWRFAFEGDGWGVEQVVRHYQGYGVFEFQPVVHNYGPEALLLRRVDSLDLTLVAMGITINGYTGNWGSEFEPILFKPYQPFVLESRWGRSSRGNHPWAFIAAESGEGLAVSVAWSGNWVLRFDPQPVGALRLSGGLHDWQFHKRLMPGESFAGATVVLALGEDLNAISQNLARVGRRFWYPTNELASRLPVEWNHWWPYEDAEINEAVFLANAERAAELGFEVCTLDAGWFGPAEMDAFWYDYRGDWHRVNHRRFPRGLCHLAERVHALGMKFGIWCEIEAVGPRSALAHERPDLLAKRDGVSLGYVCMGNPAAQEWAYQTLARLIGEYGADWIKLDFNLDPGAGCNRTDHGHQEGDGLYEHYRGYYSLLARVRRNFPEVVLENCSSGGLRIDLGILRQTHMTFLSDPDWPVHSLQVFWGASTMLAPSTLLHWSYGHWRNADPPPQQRFNPFDPSLTRAKLDYYARVSMLGWYGVSQKLTDLPAWMAERIAQHNQMYKTEVRRFVAQGDLYRLTDQPRRTGIGDRWAAFQYRLPDGDEHLLFVFRLPGGEGKRAIPLRALEPDRAYRICGLEGEIEQEESGENLMHRGLEIDGLQEEESLLMKIQKV